MKLPSVRPALPSAPGGVTPAIGKLGQWAAGYVFGTARGQWWFHGRDVGTADEHPSDRCGF